MKKLILILPLIALILASGCIKGESVTGKLTDAAPGGNNIEFLQSQIKAGMTYAEVKGAAGDPEEVQMVSDPLVYWYYSEGSDVLQIVFVNGKVTATHFY
ncbi:MAG: hypothetical protein QXH80_03675 [Candidatus Nanoarchaeia archaeon]